MHIKKYQMNKKIVWLPMVYDNQTSELTDDEPVKDSVLYPVLAGMAGETAIAGISSGCTDDHVIIVEPQHIRILRCMGLVA
jgi:hypothetical protein